MSDVISVLFSLGNTDKAQGKTYSLCPYCYNHTPSFRSFEALLAEGGAEGEDGDRDEVCCFVVSL